MTQTARGQKDSSSKSTQSEQRQSRSNASSKAPSLGQRQQERRERLLRRRRRQRNVLLLVALLFLISAAGVGAWQYQKIEADKQTALDNHATATAKACAAPSLTAGPATPPALPANSKVVTLDKGLQYVDLKQGCGSATVQKGSQVSVQYTGWLKKDGKKFQSSYDQGGSPVSLTIADGQVIAGWVEGLVGMKEGSTRRLIIPAALAYGKESPDASIPANSDLIFEVSIVTLNAGA